MINFLIGINLYSVKIRSIRKIFFSLSFYKIINVNRDELTIAVVLLILIAVVLLILIAVVLLILIAVVLLILTDSLTEYKRFFSELVNLFYQFVKLLVFLMNSSLSFFKFSSVFEISFFSGYCNCKIIKISLCYSPIFSPADEYLFYT